MLELNSNTEEMIPASGRHWFAAYVSVHHVSVVNIKVCAKVSVYYTYITVIVNIRMLANYCIYQMFEYLSQL